MINFEFIKNHILSSVKAEALPDISFKQGSNLYAELLKNIPADTAAVEGGTELEQVTAWLDSFTEADKESLVGVISTVATSFEEKITDGITSLKELHNTVETLQGGINEEYNRRIALDPKLAKASEGESVDFALESYDFSALATVGDSASVINGVEETVIDSGDLSAEYKFKVSCSRYLPRMLSGVTTGQLVIDEESKQKIATSLLEKGHDTESVTAVLSHLTKGTGLNALVSETKSTIVDQPSTDKAMYKCMDVVNKYGPCLTDAEGAIVGAGFDPDAINGNVKILSSVLDICAYFVYHHRLYTYNDTVLFSNGLKNPDVATKATAAGITDEDVVKHRTVVNSNLPISKIGLTVEKLTSSKERVADTYANSSAEDEKYVTAKQNDIMVRTVSVVLSNHVKEFNSRDMYDDIAYAAGKMVINKTPLHDVLYGVLLKVMHKDTMVEELYHKLGAKYNEVLNNNKTVDQDLVDESTVKVYAEIITKFISKYFVEFA